MNGAHTGRGTRPAVLIGLLVLLLLVVGGGLFAAGRLGWERLAIHPGCGGRDFATRTPSNFTASNASGSLTVDATAYRFTGYRDVELPSRGDGVTIRGWYAPGPGATASPTVILAHGIYSCRRDPVTLLPAAMLHRAGFGVLIIDLRNHGDSATDDGRSALGAKEYRDLLGAWDWLVAQGHDPTRIGLFGTSLSAASALIAGGAEPRIAAIWEDSAFADTETMLEEQAGAAGYPSWLGRTIVPVSRLLGVSEIGMRTPIGSIGGLWEIPLAIVHGADDTFVLPHHATDLADEVAASGFTVTPWLVPGAGHQEAVLLAPADYESRLVDFFRRTIGMTGGG